ncbi:hypothetical protein GCK32_020297, partial [Trichostrongylus colubriformis]
MLTTSAESYDCGASFRSHSFEVYIREPHGFDKVNWMQYGTLERNQAKLCKSCPSKASFTSR